MTKAEQPISEDALADYLIRTPEFFERQVEVLAKVRLISPFGKRVVSLQERQAEILREKIKILERQMMNLIRNGNENGVISEKLMDWSEVLMHHRGESDLAQFVERSIAEKFSVPQVALRLWAFASDAQDDAKAWVADLEAPYCGSPLESTGVLAWLPEPANVASIAVLPLHDMRVVPTSKGAQCFGALLLASPDSQRFQDDMSTDFLKRIATLLSSALAV